MEKPFGKYILLGRLGGGGMAEVFQARLVGPEGFEKHLALKLILQHCSNDPDFVSMFIQEATLAAKLDHANIVRIYEFNQVEGRYYIAMEFVDGRDLRQVLIRSREINRPLTVPEVLVIAEEVCKGLAFAHGELSPNGEEIVHRDISPHNVILSRAGEVKITDFGIAKLVSQASMTKNGVIKGKLGYMSPEQANGESVDRRSDLFSLGCVLWELFTGFRLFTGDGEQAIRTRLQNMPIPKVSSHNPDIPAELDSIIQRLLARKKDERFQSARALLGELDRILLLYPDVVRTNLLIDLYQNLFQGAPKHSKTAVMPGPQKSSTIMQTSESLGSSIDAPRRFTNYKRFFIGATIGVLVLGAAIGAGVKFFQTSGAEDQDESVLSTQSEPQTQPHRTKLEVSEPQQPEPQVSGSLQPKPQGTEPRQTEPRQTEPQETEPQQTEPRQQISSQQAPSQPESKKVVINPHSRQIASRESKNDSLDRSAMDNAALTADKGILRVKSKPSDLVVYFGDKELGRTPLEVAVPIGDHVIWVVSGDKKVRRSFVAPIRSQQVFQYRVNMN